LGGVTLDQVRAMGNGAGTMGMSFLAFVAMWTAIMAAMMFSVHGTVRDSLDVSSCVEAPSFQV
jgi:hypothetical protein